MCNASREGGQDNAERCPPVSNPDVKHLNGGRDRELETSRYTVTPVTPPDELSTQEMLFPDRVVPTPLISDEAPAYGCVAEGSLTVDPRCPQCGRLSCVAFGARGRVCMRCAYCERPDEALNAP